MESSATLTELRSSPKTMIEFARTIGLSPTVVSNAFTGNGRVKAETRQLVLTEAQRLGFSPNPHAQRIRGFATQKVGLYSFDFDLGVGSLKIQAMQQGLGKHGFEMQIQGISLSPPDEEEQLKRARLLIENRPRAIITHTTVCHEVWEIFREYQSQGGIIVAYGSPDFPIDCDHVALDWRYNMRLALQHLKDLGHHRIGVAGAGLTNYKSSPLVVQAWQTTCEELDVFCDDSLMFWLSRLFEQGGEELAHIWLDSPANQRPTALFVINDRVSSALVSILGQRGVRIPGDLSVVSHDHLALAAHARVPLTCVSHPWESIAAQTVQFLSERLNGYKGKSRFALLGGEIFSHSSSGPPA